MRALQHNGITFQILTSRLGRHNNFELLCASCTHVSARIWLVGNYSYLPTISTHTHLWSANIVPSWRMDTPRRCGFWDTTQNHRLQCYPPAKPHHWSEDIVSAYHIISCHVMSCHLHLPIYWWRRIDLSWPVDSKKFRGRSYILPVPLLETPSFRTRQQWHHLRPPSHGHGARSASARFRRWGCISPVDPPLLGWKEVTVITEFHTELSPLLNAPEAPLIYEGKMSMYLFVWALVWLLLRIA